MLVEINLNPAALLYRAKLLIRARSEIKQGAIALPSCTWKVERKNVSDLNDKDMVRDWMRSLAYGASYLGENSGRDFTFVTLIRISSDQDAFTISLYCPYMQIIDQIGNRSVRERLSKRFEKIDVEIRHKYALLDALCPVVVSYSSAANQVLLTNENQLSNPIQFLDPDRCDMTSGLLNFIGVLSLLDLHQNAGAHYQRASEWMKSAMASKRDEWLRWFFHLADQNVIFETSRILVDPVNPETYFYDYSTSQTKELHP